MTRTRIMAATISAATLLTLGACGSDEPEAASPATSSSTPAAAPTTGSPTAPATTAPTPQPSASTTTSAPAGRLIDYEALDENGITIATAADTGKLTGATADFKAFIAAQIKQQAATETQGCTETPQISVTRIDTGGWARGSYVIPGCGGSGALWSNAKGSWATAWEGQSLVDCATLNAYRFPSRVAGETCDDGGDQAPYSR